MSEEFTTPLRFDPIFKEKIWGGRALREILGKDAPAKLSIGESWEISGWGDSQTIVSSGEYKGMTLGDLFAHDPEGLIGAGGREQKGFPLLFKFIDAREDLSIQVHPNSKQARAHGWGERGKTEAWYVVGAKPDARIAIGFNRRNITREEVKAAVGEGRLEELMNFIPAAAGDTFFIPAGTVHAILGGVLIYEIQEESNATLRLYDWNRKGLSGIPRELHVDRALDIIKFDEDRPLKPEPALIEESDSYKYELLCGNSKFLLSRYRFSKSGRAGVDTAGGFKVISLTSGVVELRCGQNVSQLCKGQTILIPAATADIKLEGAPNTEALVTAASSQPVRLSTKY